MEATSLSEDEQEAFLVRCNHGSHDLSSEDAHDLLSGTIFRANTISKLQHRTGFKAAIAHKT